MKVPRSGLTETARNTNERSTAKASLVHPILQMQSLVGNRATIQLLQAQMGVAQLANKKGKQKAKKATSKVQVQSDSESDVDDEVEEDGEAVASSALATMKQTLTTTRASIAGQEDAEVLQGILDDISTYTDDVARYFEEDLEEHKLENEEAITLQAELYELIEQIETEASTKLNGIKDTAFAEWNHKIAERKVPHQTRRQNQATKWNQVMVYQPSLVNEYNKWQGEFNADENWWDTLPDRDTWFAASETFEAELAEHEKNCKDWDDKLGFKLSEGVDKDLDIHDPAHIRLHEADDPGKHKHGVFNGNALFMTRLAWKHKGGTAPVSDGADAEKYHIPFPNAGIQRGMNTTAGYGSALHHVTIVVEKGKTRVITAYPSTGT